MDDADHTAMIGRVTPSDPPESPWADGNLADTGADDRPGADTAAGLASLSFLTAAIRRRRRLWGFAAAVGLILGAGLYVVQPPPYQATAQAYLTLGPNEDLGTSIDTDVALAESSPVAALALHKLGLHESVSKFLGTYTAADVTNRIILITISAPSSDGAVRGANDVITAFLQFRADQLTAYQRLVSISLNQEIASAKVQVAPLARRISALSGNAASPAQRAELSDLQTQLNALANQQQSALSTRASVQAQTNVAVRGSYILDAAAPVLHSRKKAAVIDALTGLIAGLALGIGFVVVRALLSDRLRSRDDIAYALGASVRLSVGRVRVRRRLLPGRHGLAAVGNQDIQRIAGHLRGRLPDDLRGAALVVVPAGRADAAAVAIVALACSCAVGDNLVIVADLFPGRPAARLLGAKAPGVHTVQVQGTRLVVAVPERNDVAPAGPLTPTVAPASVLGPDLGVAYSPADVLLTLAAVDPLFGAEHLSTWAADVVVMVTAGESSWTRVQAVGEMIRLSGTRLVSAVLVGADKSDESLGVASPPRAGRHLKEDESLDVATPRVSHDAKAAGNGSHLGARGFFVPADADPGTEPPGTR